MSAVQLLVGIDVAKAQLDMALRPTGERWAVANEDTSIAALVVRLQARQPTLMVLEATGGIPAGRGRRARGGRSPRRGGQSSASARLCQSHRAVGQDGCPRRAGRGACRRGRASDPSASAGGPGRRTPGTAGAAAAIGRQADSRTAPASGVRPRDSRPIFRPISRGSTLGWRPWMMTWTRRCGRVRYGGSARHCSAAYPALAQ